MEMIPSPQLGFLRGVFPANHLASIDNLTRTSCARCETICPRPSPPVGTQAPRAPPSRCNVAVAYFPTPNTFSRWPLQPPYALRPRWVKRPGNHRPLTLKVVSESCVTWAISVPILVFLGSLFPSYARCTRQTNVRPRWVPSPIRGGA